MNDLELCKYVKFIFNLYTNIPLDYNIVHIKKKYAILKILSVKGSCFRGRALYTDTGYLCNIDLEPLGLFAKVMIKKRSWWKYIDD
jgi:hypothetical protein